MTGPVVTCWHFSVPWRDGHIHAHVPGTLSGVARARLRASGDALWADAAPVTEHGGWVIDGLHYRCVPRDRVVLWFAQLPEPTAQDLAKFVADAG